MADYTTNQQEIVDIFILASNDLQRTPSTTDLEDYQVTRSMLRTRFGGYRQLVKAMRASHRELFKDVNLSDLTTAENNRVLLEAVKSTRRFVITTAVVGCVVDAHFLAAIDQYCEPSTDSNLSGFGQRKESKP